MRVYVFKELLLTKKADRILKLTLFENTLSLFWNQSKTNLKYYEGEHRKQTITLNIMI